MSRLLSTRSGRLIGLAAVLAALPAIRPAAAEQVRCRRTLSGESAKYVQTVVKALQGCRDRQVAGTLPPATNCVTEPATAARIAKAEARLRGRIVGACGGADHACGTADDDSLAAIGWNSGTCPDLGGKGCTNAISDCGDIADCLACAGRAAAGESMDLCYASLASGEFGTGSTLNRCQRTIGKETARYFRTAAKVLGRCWSGRLRGAHTNACPTPGDGKAGPAIAAADARKVARICAACGGGDGCGGTNDSTPAQIGFPSSCPAVAVPAGPSCSASISALQPLVDCVDCVTESAAECAAILAVPAVASYSAACNPVTTTTTTVTTATCPSTTSTTAFPCPAAPPTPLGSAKIKILPGSTACGGPHLVPGASPPISGEVDYLDGTKRADLGLGCLYSGGGLAIPPPLSMSDGSTLTVDVAGVNGAAFTLVASNGTGPADCTKGAGPGRHCVNNFPGTDGNGACDCDLNCGSRAGACQLDANCYFGAPIPFEFLNNGVCVVNAVQSDVCGSANLATNETSLAVSVSSRIHLTLNPTSPCPQCLSGTCHGGERDGLPCSGGVGTRNTTVECLPHPEQFAGLQSISLSGLSSGTVTVTDPVGNFCPGQRTPGAFGGEAGTIRETGTPLGSAGTGLLDTTFAGILCVPASGNTLFDVEGDLPGPAAVSVPVRIGFCLLPAVCNTLCNPCLLPPLCSTLCSSCLTCVSP